MNKNRIIKIVVVAIIFLSAMAYVIYSKNSNEIEIVEEDSADLLDISFEPFESFTLTDVWDDSATEDVTVELELPEYDDKIKLNIPAANSNNCITLTYKGDEIRRLFDDEKRPEAIKAIRVCDINYDGKSELIVIADTSYGDEWLLFKVDSGDEYETPYKIRYKKEYFKDHPQNMSVMETLDCIENIFNGVNKNGQFKSYKEAYKAVIDSYEHLYEISSNREQFGEWQYSLVYINDDSTPELVVSNWPEIVLYSYQDGYLKNIISDNDYYPTYNSMGFDSLTYSYIPKKSIIRAYYCDDDDGGYRAQLFYKYSNNGLKKLYLYYESDKELSENYTNEDLSLEQILKKGKKLSEQNYEPLSGEKNAEEIKRSLLSK